MQHLTIISRSKMDCQVYFDGKHQNLNTRFKREAELDAYIAKLLSEGWRLFNVDGGQMYLVYDQEESRPAAYPQSSGREKGPFVEESASDQPLSWLTKPQPGRSGR
ncbi:MAG TPA: hypothetical protein VKQ72_12675 [Aggregatilineales bacterium]|nr:hypothetical protein [Aggregatilineales bacterium]